MTIESVITIMNADGFDENTTKKVKLGQAAYNAVKSGLGFSNASKIKGVPFILDTNLSVEAVELES